MSKPGTLYWPDALPQNLRRISTVRDQLCESVRERGQHLTPADRSLLEALVLHGQSMTAAAALMGISTRALRRRFRALIVLITSRRFQWVLLHRAAWPAGSMRRRVAEACFLRGASQRAAARELRLSLFAVRSHWAAVLAMSEAGHLAA